MVVRNLLSLLKVTTALGVVVWIVGCGQISGLIKKIDSNSSTPIHLSLDQSSVTVPEGSVLVLSVLLSDRSSSPIVASISFTGPADKATRFVTPPTSLTIPAGSLARSLTIQTNADGVYEGAGDYLLSFSVSDSSITVGPGTLNIHLTDTAPNVMFSSASQSVLESAGTVTVTASLDGPSTFQTLVPFTVSGSATAGGTDHDAANGTLTITAGSTTANYTFSVIDDATYESSETVIFTMGSVTNAVVSSPSVHTVTINDNDATYNLTISDVTVSEGTGAGTTNAIFIVSLSPTSPTTTTFDYTTTGSTALGGGVDFTDESGTLTITAGSTQASITVPITRDALYESTEIFYLDLSNPTNANLADSRGVGTINDDDVAPAVNFASAAQSISESIGTVTVTAQLSAPSGLAATVPFTLSGTASGGGVDHNATAGTLTIAAGTTTANYTFTVSDDTLYEPSETVVFTLGAPTNASLGSTSIHTATITDNDSAPVLNLTAATQTVSEGVGSVTVTAQLSAMSALEATVPYTVTGTATAGGTDHNATNGTLTIAAGTTTTNYTFTVTDDSLYELSETVILTLGSPTASTLGSTTIQTITINDNDSAPTVNFTSATQSVNESVGTVTLTAGISAVSGVSVTIPFTVTGTATAGGVDHNGADGSISIAAGSTTATYTFTVTDDVLYEATETVILSMGSVTGATKGSTSIQTVNISDNDSAPSFAISDVSVTEGTGGGTTTAVFTVSIDATSGLSSIVDYTTTANTATGAGTDYSTTSGTITISAGSTTALVTVTITRDSLCETNETFYVQLSNASNATIGDNQGIGTINDDDSGQITIQPVNVIPGVTADFIANLSQSCGGNATFDYATQNGTASSGSDYTANSGTATIAAGQTSTTINVSTASQVLGSSKTFSVLLSNLSANTTAASTTITGTIAAPALDLDLTTSLPGTVTLTRSSPGSYYDADRILRIAAANQGRFDHDPTTGEPIGLLVEEARTNLLKYSAVLSVSPWSLQFTSVMNDVETAPDGSLTADKIISKTATQSRVELVLSTPGVATTYSFSTYAKRGSTAMAGLGHYDGTNNRVVIFNLDTQAVAETMGTIDGYGIQELPNGWYRIWMTFTVGASITQNIVKLFVEDGTGWGAGSSNFDYVYYWGAQFEVGATPSSYIPASGSTSTTRAQDVVSTSNVTWATSGKGTIIANGRRTYAPESSTLRALASFNDGTSANVMQMNASGYSGGQNFNWNNVSSSSTIQSLTASANSWSTGRLHSAAYTYSNNDFRPALDGALQTAATSGTVPTGFTAFNLGHQNSTNFWNGNISHITYYGVRLNDASLQTATTVSTKPILKIADATSNEGQDLVFTMSLSSTIGTAVTANWTASGGTATAGVDYTGGTSGTLTIAAGSASATLTLPAVDDSTLEGSETFTVALSGLPSTVIAGDTSATGTIRDATLNLDFTSLPGTNARAVNSTVLHSRSTSSGIAGTYFDSTGTLKSAPINLCIYSEKIEYGTWAATNMSVQADAALAPDGTLTADQVFENTVSGSHGYTQTVSSAPASTTVTFSIYAKAGTRSWIRLSQTDKSNTGSHAWFNLGTGVTGTVNAGLTAAITSMGSGWYRISISGSTGSGATNYSIGFRTATADNTQFFAGTVNDGLYVWGAQLEYGSTATTYIPTFSTNSYAPRYNHDPNQCASGTLPSCTRKLIGLLVESQATNLIWPTEDASHANWTKTATTVSTNAVAAVDGTTTADKIIETAATSTHMIEQSITKAASAITYTGSIFIKTAERTNVGLLLTDSGGTNYAYAIYDLSGLTSLGSGTQGTGFTYLGYSVQTIGSGWYRITLSTTSNSDTTLKLKVALYSGASSSYLGDGTSGLYVWGAQLETGSVPTSYMPATTATVTRNADLLTVPIGSWFSTSWTTLADVARNNYEPSSSSSTPRLWEFNNSSTTPTTANRISAFFSAATSYFSFDVWSGNSSKGSGNFGASTPTTSTIYQAAYTQSGLNVATMVNGTSGGTATLTAIPTVDLFSIGTDSTTSQWNGHVQRIYYFPRVLTNPQLTTFTTD